MFPDPDSVIAFGLMRHHELQAETVQVRKAMAALACRPAQPRRVRSRRTWVGSVFVRIGTALQFQTPGPGVPHQARSADIA
jgi:hypothetical protein